MSAASPTSASPTSASASPKPFRLINFPFLEFSHGTKYFTDTLLNRNAFVAREEPPKINTSTVGLVVILQWTLSCEFARRCGIDVPNVLCDPNRIHFFFYKTDFYEQLALAGIWREKFAIDTIKDIDKLFVTMTIFWITKFSFLGEAVTRTEKVITKTRQVLKNHYSAQLTTEEYQESYTEVRSLWTDRSATYCFWKDVVVSAITAFCLTFDLDEVTKENEHLQEFLSFDSPAIIEERRDSAAHLYERAYMNFAELTSSETSIVGKTFPKTFLKDQLLAKRATTTTTTSVPSSSQGATTVAAAAAPPTFLRCNFHLLVFALLSEILQMPCLKNRTFNTVSSIKQEHQTEEKEQPMNEIGQRRERE